jgi:muramoyltetrapeptide carboxypeptidase
VRILRPSSREKEDLLSRRLEEFKRRGVKASCRDLPPEPRWFPVAATLEDRLRELIEAVEDPTVHVLWAGRGGYGASDLLPHLPWDKWKSLTPKVIVGYSDCSALHSAFFTRLKWPGLHAPMPLHESWGKEGVEEDLTATFDVLKAAAPKGQIAITASSAPIEGTLFGGCFSVLTNLLGTPFFPRSLEGCVLFFEDIQEPPGRLARMFNQWLQTGALRGVKALVLGRFPQANDPREALEATLLEELSRRAPCLVVTSRDFGHVTPNFPLLVGGHARLSGSTLSWTFERALSDQTRHTNHSQGDFLS